MNNESNGKILADDPRVTAFALGELHGEEHEFMAAVIQSDPELQAVVADLRTFGGCLANALVEEAEATPVRPIEMMPAQSRGRTIPFSWLGLATLAAACFAVVVGLRYDDTAPPKQLAYEPGPAAPKPISEMEHRLQMARGAGGVITAPPAVGEKIYSDDAKALLNLPEMPSLPSMGAGGFGGFGGMGAGRAMKSEMSTGLGAGVQTQGGVGFMRLSFLGVTSSSPREEFGSSESYSHPGDNSFISVSTEPLSTFSIDVDTASYANVRRFITGGRLPPLAAVRVEEMVNYFPYRYAPPKGTEPFAAKLEVASAPWAPEHRLVRIGIKGRELTAKSRPPANLVFLLDVSGSMKAANKLPLVKESLRMLVERLGPDDRVAIVIYASGTGLALPSTPASRKDEILLALDRLASGGSTNGAMGIHLAYDVAKANFIDAGINRVILCTDGDFNVGVTGQDELVSLIEEKAKRRVFLSVFGFGMGNIKDSTLEAISSKGNGTYGYIDTLREAEKVFIEQVEGTLATIAKDVKIQVEFNPVKVASYRLIGYENRLLKKEDFNNDAVDAGDIGAGHTVTALYEIVPVGVDEDSVRPQVDALKYQSAAKPVRPQSGGGSPELLTVKIRYKAPDGDVSQKQEFPLIDAGRDFAQADGEFRFAAAVAAWGMILRDSPQKGSATFGDVLNWAEDGLGDDINGHRSEFIQLVRRSEALSK